MALVAEWARYTLLFRERAVTSRDVLTERRTWYLRITDTDSNRSGMGECALFRGLGDDDCPDYEERLRAMCRDINRGLKPEAPNYTSLRFGLETALADLDNGGRHIPFPSAWSNGDSSMPINGLIWMGTAQEMMARIEAKMAVGFRCLKLKIGGLDFAEELKLLEHIRCHLPASQLELRLDANGAFSPADAMSKLRELARFDIHSIEQPIKPRQWTEMARLCADSPIPIALDEELIGCKTSAQKEQILDSICPAYIILKPSLCGGFSSADEWIAMAEERRIGWWATSALESNIGLNAIAQWVATKNPTLPQGLGTGQLYVNNIVSPLRQHHDVLDVDVSAQWQFPSLQWHRE